MIIFFIETTPRTKICFLVHIFDRMNSFSYYSRLSHFFKDHAHEICSLILLPMPSCKPLIFHGTIWAQQPTVGVFCLWIPGHALLIRTLFHKVLHGLIQSPSVYGLFLHPDSKVVNDRPLVLSYHSLAQCWAHTRYSNLPQWFIYSMLPSPL